MPVGKDKIKNFAFPPNPLLQNPPITDTINLKERKNGYSAKAGK